MPGKLSHSSIFITYGEGIRCLWRWSGGGGARGTEKPDQGDSYLNRLVVEAGEGKN